MLYGFMSRLQLMCFPTTLNKPTITRYRLKLAAWPEEVEQFTTVPLEAWRHSGCGKHAFCVQRRLVVCLCRRRSTRHCARQLVGERLTTAREQLS
jgi:hypothetical protein